MIKVTEFWRSNPGVNLGAGSRKKWIVGENLGWHANWLAEPAQIFPYNLLSVYNSLVHDPALSLFLSHAYMYLFYEIYIIQQE